MRQHRKQGKSIFQFIFAAMLIVLGIEVALLIGTLYFGNVGTQMNRNAIDILKKQVENRQNYLQNTLEETQNLSSLAGTINTAVGNQTAVENISVEELVNNEGRSTELLETVSDSLINVMRHRSVNGTAQKFPKAHPAPVSVLSQPLSGPHCSPAFSVSGRN